MLRFASIIIVVSSPLLSMFLSSCAPCEGNACYARAADSSVNADATQPSEGSGREATTNPTVTSDPGIQSTPEEDTPETPILRVPNTEHCEPVAGWTWAHTTLENEIVQEVNRRRAMGADCKEEGQFDPAPPLTVNPNLRCASRLHSKDMFERDYFNHVSPDGVNPGQRIEAAGYIGFGVGENILKGNVPVAYGVQSWIDSPGHCRNLMDPRFKETGLGVYNEYWTQTFGTREAQ